LIERIDAREAGFDDSTGEIAEVRDCARRLSIVR
jgi:hypothetical protein